jgi:hypothetical protein
MLFGLKLKVHMHLIFKIIQKSINFICTYFIGNVGSLTIYQNNRHPNKSLLHWKTNPLLSQGLLRLLYGSWFTSSPVSFTNKNDSNDITEILLKVVLNTITLTLANHY